MAGSLGAVAAFTCASVLTPTASADDLKHKRHQVHQRVNGARTDLDESSRALTGAQHRLATANREFTAAQAKLSNAQQQLVAAQAVDRQMAAKLAKAQQRLVSAQSAVTKAKQDVANQQQSIGQLIAASYSYGDPQLMGFSAVVGATSPYDVTSQLGSVDSVMNARTAALARFRDAQKTLTAREADVAKAEKDVAAQRQQSAEYLDHTQQLQQAATEAESSVRSVVSTRKSAASHAAHVRASNARTLKSLQRREVAIKRQIIAQARRERNQRVANLGNGFMLKPVPGGITSPFGWRIHPIYHYWGLHDGDDFHAPCGTPERAVRSGKVTQEYYSSVWGNRLYLDLGKINGHNYTVIYNHLTSYVAHKGQRVTRGQTVGLAGTTGWSTACHLHFTVMKDGTAVNPTQFF